MMGRSHVLLGAACYLALWRHAVVTPLGPLAAPLLGGPALDAAPELAVAGVSLLVASASALGPDIDKRGSTLARAGGWATGVLAWSLEHTVHHRGPLHSRAGLSAGLAPVPAQPSGCAARAGRRAGHRLARGRVL